MIYGSLEQIFLICHRLPVVHAASDATTSFSHVVSLVKDWLGEKKLKDDLRDCEGKFELILV